MDIHIHIYTSPFHCFNRMAYADFGSSEELEKAISLSGSNLNGYTLRIEQARPRNSFSGGGGSFGSGDRQRGRGRGRGGGQSGGGRFNDEDRAPSKTLIVMSLSYDTSRDTLQRVFKSANEVRIATDRDTGESRG